MTIPLAVAAGKTQQMRPGETIPIAYGGTGSTTASAALVALGAEIALGNPGTSGYVLSSTTGGVRSWVPQGAFSGILASSQGGTGVNNGSFTLTIPATGTAALLGTAQTFSATNTFSAGLNVGTATGAGLGQLNIASSGANTYHLKFSGAEAYQPANSGPSTEGVSATLLVNRAGNKQIFIRDTALAANSTNAMFRLMIMNNIAAFDVISTDQTTQLPLTTYGGLNVGSETGATAGQIRASGALLVNGNYTLYASGGPVSIDVQQAGTAAMWYGRIATRNANGKAAFLGTYGASVAGVFAHSGALDAWADLYVNTVNGSTGGNVRLPEATYINGSLALHAGNVSSYAVTSGSSPTFGAVYTSNWFRSLGNTGWYNGTYEGGILMQDSSTIRTYGSKNFFVENGNLTVSGTITAYQGLTWESWQGVYGHGSGWWNYGGEYSGFGYAKDSLGIVHLRGLVCTNTTSILVATLPEGYRPTGREIFVCDSSAGRVRVDVRANGQILAMEMTGAYGYLSLAGITFRVF